MPPKKRLNNTPKPASDVKSHEDLYREVLEKQKRNLDAEFTLMEDKTRTLALEREKLQLEKTVLELKRLRYVQQHQASFYGMYQPFQTTLTHGGPTTSGLTTLDSANTLPSFSIFGTEPVHLPEKILEISMEDKKE